MRIFNQNFYPMKSIITTIICIAFALSAAAQTKHTISGTISDISTGETLSGATVTVAQIAGTGASSNVYGFYSLTIPEGKYTLIVSFLGFKVLEYPVTLDSNKSENFRLEQLTTALNQVDIFPYRKNENIISDKIGVETLTISKIKDIPVFLGEADVMKTLALTPGVKAIGDGNGSLYVRGGNDSQNLVLLDEATVYHAHHLLGFFSTFNSDAIKDLTLYKGTAPVEYGGRLSSVMDVRMKEGNNQHFSMNGGIGLISSRMTVEAPIVKDKGSFLISGRRTYIDMLLKASPDQSVNSNTMNFYDLNAKMNFKLNDRNRIYLSAYSGRDAFGVPERFGLEWGNRTATFRWNHIWNEKLFSNTSLIFSDFDYNVDLGLDLSPYSLFSKIENYNFKQEFQYYANEKSSFMFGYSGIYHQIVPGQVEADDDAAVNPVRIQERYGLEHSFYIGNNLKLSPKWNINYGIRLNIFNETGPGDFYRYKDGQLQTTTSYGKGETVKTYVFPERRVSISHIINQEQSLKMAYSTNTQNIHLITTSSSSLPVDIWIMSSQNIKPQKSDQWSLGYYRNFNKDMYQFSAETYFKWMQNQLDLKNGADILANQHIEAELLSGTGRAYGLELMLKKEYGTLNGWISYTYSGTQLRIPGINDGNWYAARQDATHDLSIVGIYNLSKSLTFSATWVYQTGNAVTFPSGKYEINGEIKYYSSERNGYRMPDYHRLDLGLTWNFKKKKNFESSLNFSVFNAYGRKNAFAIDFEEDPQDPTKTRAIMTYLFTAIPSITYNFNF